LTRQQKKRIRISFVCLLGGCVMNSVLFGDIYCWPVFNDTCCMLSLCYTLYTCIHTCMPSSMYRIGAHIFEPKIYNMYVCMMYVCIYICILYIYIYIYVYVYMYIYVYVYQPKIYVRMFIFIYSMCLVQSYYKLTYYMYA
jgi:hypothetical protein